MTEYTIHIDSTEALGTEEGLTAMHKTLVASTTALGAAVSIDQAGAYSCTFQVEAPTIDTAVVLATIEFRRALFAAGHPHDAIAHLEVGLDTVAA